MNFDDLNLNDDLPLKILLADPDQKQREQCRRELMTDDFQQWEVIEARTGRETISKYDQEHPGCIILSLDLLDLDGMKILQYIKEDQYWHCAVIIIASENHEQQGVAAIKNGAS